MHAFAGGRPIEGNLVLAFFIVTF